MREQDKFILSKGHAALALYAVLASKGIIPAKELETFCQKGSRLEGHPTNKISGVEVNTGSLGNGLGIGAGWALASKMDKLDRKTYVLLGDGECYEGAIWEAAMFAAHHKLDNLVAIIDRNKQCVLDYTEEINKLNPLADKWRAFGWHVSEIYDGHNLTALQHALKISYLKDKPRVIIANTVKGKGISFMEGKIKWHAGVPDAEEIIIARKELWI